MGFARKVGIHALLCATFVCSVPLWFIIAQKKTTTETQSTQRLHREEAEQRLFVQSHLNALSVVERTHLIARIENLENNLAGDVKRLTHVTPDFRLRVGNYRILFEVKSDRVIIYRVRHRRSAYR